MLEPAFMWYQVASTEHHNVRQVSWDTESYYNTSHALLLVAVVCGSHSSRRQKQHYRLAYCLTETIPSNSDRDGGSACLCLVVPCFILEVLHTGALVRGACGAFPPTEPKRRSLHEKTRATFCLNLMAHMSRAASVDIDVVILLL